jgi:hypothetical protein
LALVSFPENKQDVIIKPLKKAPKGDLIGLQVRAIIIQPSTILSKLRQSLRDATRDRASQPREINISKKHNLNLNLNLKLPIRSKDAFSPYIPS